MNINEVLSHFEHVRPVGEAWTARCSAHEDRTPSLSISEKNGKILMHCHRGCPVDRVIEAAGLKIGDLFVDSPQAKIVSVYDYPDESGRLLYQVVRFEPKDFRQRRPAGDRWNWNLKGVRRVLYRLPDVLKSKSVLIVEGEKDCETARKLGLVGTCNAGGAGKWREHYTECLRGKRVVIIADADEPGRKHAQEIAASLFGRTESLKVIELPAAKDLSEWVERGGTREALLELIRSTPDHKPAASPSVRTPLIAIGVEELLTREIKPREMLLDPVLPTQGLAMLYSKRGVGKTHIGLGISVGGCCRWRGFPPLESTQ
jgi:putative DNA primase/helicase